MKKLLAGLLAAVLLTAPAFGDDTVWDSLEDRYYEDISKTETDITLRFLEEGDQLDWSRAVRRYHMEDSLLTRSGVDAFLTAVRSGELLSSRISYDERLMVYQPLSEAPAFLEEGTAYTLEELADLVEEHAGELIRYEGLNAGLDPEKPNVVTGAQPELSPQPEKENVDTGR